MSTPTPGDLSARLRIIACDYPLGSIIRNTLDQTIAALSALPAGGGAVTEWRWVDERGRAMTNWKQGDPPPMTAVTDTKGTMHVEVRTTPQPSAAVLEDGGPPCSTHPDAPHGFNRNASHTEGRYVCDCEGWKPDAAAEIVRDLCELDPYDPDAEDAVCVRLRDLELIVNRALNSQDAAVGAPGDDNDAIPCGQCGSTWPPYLLKDGQCIKCRKAAPAAGKGVDDAMVDSVRADIMASAANEGRCDVVIKDEWVRAALEAALTRQPVAGDGMVLVPREQLSSLADILHDNRTTTDSGLPVTVLECIDVAQAAATEIRRLLAAAPAATPTDGGEG